MERREFKSAWRMNKDRAGGERGGRAREREESGGRRGREQGESESKRERERPEEKSPTGRGSQLGRALGPQRIQIHKQNPPRSPAIYFPFIFAPQSVPQSAFFPFRGLFLPDTAPGRPPRRLQIR